MSKLTEEEVKEIREALDQYKFNCFLVSRVTGHSIKTVRDIRYSRNAYAGVYKYSTKKDCIRARGISYKKTLEVEGEPDSRNRSYKKRLSIYLTFRNQRTVQRNVKLALSVRLRIVIYSKRR